MTQKEEVVNLETLFKFIKPFDGSREKLNSFLTNCGNAFDLATEKQEDILFRFILSRLEGKAEAACSIKEFLNWDQLSDFLKVQFGERKHYTHLLTDLQECRQLHNESVSQYSLRIETCLSKLLTEITLSNKIKKELPGRITAMEDLALHTFLLGLNTSISHSVRGSNPSDLNQAINIAKSEEKIYNVLLKRNSINTRSAPVSRPNPRPQSGFKPAWNSNASPYVPKVNPNPPICRYCKALGHTIEQCRKREFNNNRFGINQRQPNSNQRVHFISDPTEEYNVIKTKNE